MGAMPQKQKRGSALAAGEMPKGEIASGQTSGETSPHGAGNQSYTHPYLNNLQGKPNLAKSLMNSGNGVQDGRSNEEADLPPRTALPSNNRNEYQNLAPDPKITVNKDQDIV